MILHRPGPLQTAKPPCGLVACAVPRSARWRGAPADVPLGGARTGSQALRLRCFRSVQAGSWSLGDASAPARYGSHPSRDADLCLRLLEVGPPMGCFTAAGFKL